MPHTFPLAAVLALRLQKEEAEERALGAVSVQMQQTEAAVARLERELVQHGHARAGDVHMLQDAAHHQASQARWTMLRESKRQLEERRKALETQRTEQQVRYLAARREREVLSELKTQQHMAWQVKAEAQETKRMADLLTARRLLRS